MPNSGSQEKIKGLKDACENALSTPATAHLYTHLYAIHDAYSTKPVYAKDPL